MCLTAWLQHAMQVKVLLISCPLYSAPLLCQNPCNTFSFLRKYTAHLADISPSSAGFLKKRSSVFHLLCGRKAPHVYAHWRVSIWFFCRVLFLFLLYCRRIPHKVLQLLKISSFFPHFVL